MVIYLHETKIIKVGRTLVLHNVHPTDQDAITTMTSLPSYRTDMKISGLGNSEGLGIDFCCTKLVQSPCEVGLKC